MGLEKPSGPFFLILVIEHNMHPDHRPYLKFTNRSRLDKSVNSLLGIIEGISIDGVINSSELSLLRLWLSDHNELKGKHPFSEFIPVVEAAVADGVLTQDEKDDIVWLCEKLRSTEFFDQTTADLQRLHAILGGIVADGQITETELSGLSDWLDDHEHLRTCWPYDEIGSLITAVLADKRIDENEHTMLKEFFSEFLAILDNQTIVSPSVSIETKLVGLCAVCPEIHFENSTFCFTGASTRFTRNQLAQIVSSLGGEFVNSMTAKVKYLVIGAEGNPCWAYACYGRKVEKAVELRKSGNRVLIVHENDLHDAIADHG